MKQFLLFLLLFAPLLVWSQIKDTSAVTFQIRFVASGLYLDANGRLSLPPAPGYRENNFYWNGRWWSEYEYDLGLTNFKALCAIQYFEDEDGKFFWISKFDEMSNARFNRLSDLINSDSIMKSSFFHFGDDRIYIHFVDENGRLHTNGKAFDLEEVKAMVLTCIKNSRQIQRKK